MLIRMKSISSYFTKGIVGAFFFLQFFLVRGQDVENSAFKIYSSLEQKEITLDDLVNGVSEVDVLFFGEEHNDSIAHSLQDELYQALLSKYGTVTLSLEMFETDCQVVLDEYMGGWISQGKLIKDGRAWNNYENDYSPMVMTAKDKGQTVIAANAPRRYVSMVSGKGVEVLENLPEASLTYLPSFPIYTADSAYYKRFAQAMGEVGHSMENNNYFYAQCVWDATMANRIYTRWRKHKKEMIFHLNGRFHSDYQQGTVSQLRRLTKKVQIKNISCFPVLNIDNPDWKAYAGIGDFIILSSVNSGDAAASTQ